MASEDTAQGFTIKPNTLCLNKDSFYFEDVEFHEHYTVRQMALRKDRLFTDILLKAKHLAVPCHKVVLASASPFFYRKLRCEEILDIMEFQEVSPEILEVIIDYIYTTKVEISAGNVRELVTASSELELKRLSTTCDKYISKIIEPANVLGFLMLAKNYKLQQTLIKAKKCILTQPEAILRLALDGEFYQISEEALVEYLACDDLKVPDESVAFQIAERWVNSDPYRQNEACASRVLSHVRLSQCSPAFLVKNVSKSPLMQYKKCQQQFDKVKMYTLMKQAGESIEDLEDCMTRPRRNAYKDHLVLMGGASGDEINLRCWCLEKGGTTWKELTQIPKEQADYPFEMAGCVIGESIIITGGAASRYGEDATDNCWQFSTRTWKWKALPKMLEARSNHAAVCVEQKVFVLGGIDGTDLSSVEVLDKGKKTWKNVQPMPYSLACCHAFNISGSIYALSAINKNTLKYNYGTNKWSKMTPMPGENKTCSVVAVDDSIFAVCGDIQDYCYVYDALFDTWAKIAMASTVHEYACAVQLGEDILVCGGWTDWGKDKATAEVERYNPATDEWSPYKLSLPLRLAGHQIYVAHMCTK